jgi:DNA-binding Lrp family transcriptional regulator
MYTPFPFAMAYDDNDKKLLAALRKDSQQRLVDYALITGMPKSTVHERLQKLFRSVRCTMLCDWQKLGYNITICFFVPYNEQLTHHQSVNNAQQLAPNMLYLECVFSSLKEAEEFKSHVASAKYYSVIEILKKEGFNPEIKENNLQKRAHRKQYWDHQHRNNTHELDCDIE